MRPAPSCSGPTLPSRSFSSGTPTEALDWNAHRYASRNAQFSKLDIAYCIDYHSGMENDFDKAFAKANTVEHPVEGEWHYPILTQAGFKPVTPSQTGFVRTYKYEHPDGRVITAHTGVNADYWIDQKTGKQGYWRELEPHVGGIA